MLNQKLKHLSNANTDVEGEAAVSAITLPALSTGKLKRYKQAKIRKRRNQKKIPTPKTEVGKKHKWP